MATQSSLLLSTRIISSQPSSLQLGVDESIIREQVLSTHSYDGRGFNTNFVLSTAENILNLHTGTAKKAKVEELNQVEVEELNQVEELNTYKQLPYLIRQLSFEIASGLNIANQHSTTIHVLRILSLYSWEDKLVLMLVAFSIIYGEFTLISSRLRNRKELAMKMAYLKQTPSSDNQQAVVDCISSVLELTKCVIELKQCSSYSLSQSAISALPMATYWIAISLVKLSEACVCGAHFKVQNQLGELTTLIANLLATFSPELEKKKADESFEALRYALYHNSSNKLEVFKLMFNVKDDDEKIFKNLGLNYLNSQTVVLLLITSGFDISNERIQLLNFLYPSYSSSHMIWIPITQNNASWTSEDEQQFEKLKKKMEFFWLNDPHKMLSPQFTRFIKEELFPKFQMGGEPIVVSIDPQGRIAHPNVMHIIQTWTLNSIQQNTIGVQRLHNITPWIVKELNEGTSGVNRVIPQIEKMTSDFAREIGDKVNAWTHLVEDMIQKVIDQSTPYDIEREKLLWQQEPACSLELVVGKMGRYVYFEYGIQQWIDAEDYIFLYGGNDINWIREFTSKARELSSKIQLNVKLAYFGKNERIRAIINEEKMSHCAFQKSYMVWRFWARLRSMFLSRIHYLEMINHFGEECNDEILQELKKLLAFEGKNSTIEGWALLSKGNKIVVCGHGAKMLQVINDYAIWKEDIATKGFDQAFKDHHEMFASSSSMKTHSCCTLEYSTTLNKIPENEKCPGCSSRMNKFVTFTCCHGQDIDSNHR